MMRCYHVGPCYNTLWYVMLYCVICNMCHGFSFQISTIVLSRQSRHKFDTSQYVQNEIVSTVSLIVSYSFQGKVLGLMSWECGTASGVLGSLPVCPGNLNAAVLYPCSSLWQIQTSDGTTLLGSELPLCLYPMKSYPIIIYKISLKWMSPLCLRHLVIANIK